MATQNKGQWVDGINTSQLEPGLWHNLPEELLEKVLGKLPFERLVTFRFVCKKWYSEVIPGAAPHVQASRVLYFDKQKTEYGDTLTKGYARCLHVYNAKSERNGSMEQFQLRSFPSPSSGEDVELLICKEGLLFFGFKDRKTWTVRDIIACNPLTGQSKCLGLPCPLLPPLQNPLYALRCRRLLSGVVFNSEGGSYNLVVAGEYGKGDHATFLYNSSTSTWSTGSSLLAALRKNGVYDFGQTVCCNDNLYWTVQDVKRNEKLVLKYDLLGNTWRKTEVLTIDYASSPGFNASSHLASYDGNVFLWHLHMTPSAIWLCNFDLKPELAPEVKFMPDSMIEGVNRFLAAYLKLVKGNVCYSAFSQGNCVYHVLRPLWREGAGDSLKILIHDMKENSCTELPTVPVDKFPNFGVVNPGSFWSFSASLTSAP